MIIWGLLFPMVKLGYQTLGIKTVGDILTFAGFRFLICGMVITIFAIIRNPQSFKSIKNYWVQVLLSGFFAIVLHYGFTYVGLKMTDGSKTAILKQLGAVFYICFSAFFFPDDKVTIKKISGLLLGIGGIVAINIGENGMTFHLGDLLIIAASFCTVFSNVISKKVFDFVEPIVSTGVSQLFGGIVLMIIGHGVGGDVVNIIPKTVQQITVFASILVASIISYCLWFITVKKEELSKLFIIKFSEPIFAALFGWILLSENIFNLNYFLAFLLISAGIIVASL